MQEVNALKLAKLGWRNMNWDHSRAELKEA